MYQFITFLLQALVIIYSCNGYSEIPPYVKQCSKSDPNFKACLIKNGQDAIPSIVKGDPIYHIPSFTPFKVNKVSLEASENIKLYAENVEVTGFDTMEVKDINWDTENKAIELKLFTPVLDVTGTYNMNGRILIMTLKGSGPMNNSHYDTNIAISIVYSLYTKNGKEFMKFDSIKVKFDIRKIHLYFENLLNNPQISEQMNAFMNENNQLFLGEILPSIETIILDVIKSIMNPILKKVPFDRIVLP